MSGAQETSTSRWGLGDVAIGVLAALVLSQIGVALAFEIGGYDSGDDLPLWLTAIVQVPLWGGLLGAVLMASRRKGGGSLRTDFGLAMRAVDVPVGLAAGFGGQVAIVLLLTPVYRLFGVDTDKVGQTAERLAERAVHPVDVVVLLVIVVIGAPVIEELFYRGLLLRSLRKRLSQSTAIVASAALFSALHFQPYDFLPIALFGLLVALLAVRSGRLGPAIWAHVAFNLTAVVALLMS